MAASKRISFNWSFAAMVVASLVLSGCMYDRNDAIPADAGVFATGDRELQFTAPQPGTVYVYDRHNDQLIYSGLMQRDQTITVEPDRNRISIEGRPVMESGIQNGDTRRIFFKPSPPTDEKVIIEQHRDMR